MSSIKAIILDVDGVLVGNKKGFNWPNPNPAVIDKLRSLNKQGLIVSLCSGKASFAIKPIAEKAKLDNFHIADGGAVVCNFLRNEIIEEHSINKELLKKIINILRANKIYTE